MRHRVVKLTQTLRCAGLALVLSVVHVPQALASVIYDNGAPTTVDGYPMRGVAGSAGITVADDFSFERPAIVTGVGFYIGGLPAWDRTVSYAIRVNANGLPGQIRTSGAAQNVVAAESNYPWLGGENAWLITFDLESAFLAGATTYWLELAALAPDPRLHTFWVTGGLGLIAALNYVTPGCNPWCIKVPHSSDVPNDGAFYLTGRRVSEPYPLTLIGIALVGLAFIRRRKQ